MFRFVFRFLIALLVAGLGMLSAEIAKRYVILWDALGRDDDLVGYATWQTLAWVFCVLAVSVFIWAVVSTRND